ncbi:YbgA family protein [Magnetococcus sp. PR-3]|uniref:YbgA family protein n=1 Tax=Magnetococcus sp. PR-3 TaxID=3120355 RepID=UPI002FCE2812
MITLGVSQCLLGNEVRYDGGHKHDRYITHILSDHFQLKSLCPEVEAGLGIPREPMHLQQAEPTPRVISIRTLRDLTAPLTQWSEQKAASLAQQRLCGFIFKSKSPSCGMQRVKQYTDQGMPVNSAGVGVFAQAFMAHNPMVPVEEEGRLRDAALRENFIERIFVYDRWLSLVESEGEVQALVDFHARHKFLIMSHDPVQMRALGKMVGKASKLASFEKYGQVLMSALTKRATVKKHVDVLFHLMGFFKKELSADEKAELIELFEHYHQELIPLIVPVTMVNHYVRKFKVSYLAQQWYLHPHPAELKLRNHV